MYGPGWAGPGYLAPGPAPAQFWVEGHLVDTGTPLARAHWIQGHTGYRGTVTSHPAASSSRDSVREAAVTRDTAAEERSEPVDIVYSEALLSPGW